MWIMGILGASGGAVSVDDALRLSTVFACIRVISESIASLPLKFYERLPDGGKEPFDTYPLAKLFRKPNQHQNQFEFIETLCAILCLRGNFYAGINYSQGWQKELVTLDPSRMQVNVDKNRKTYKYTDLDGKTQTYKPVRIWHPKGLSTDGITGLSPITYASKSLKLSIAAEKHGITYYENGTRMSGIAKHPGRLSEIGRQNLQKSINEGLSGDNKFRAIVFEEGLDWINVGLSNEDSQYLQTRQFQTEEICRIYRVPAVLVNHPDKTATYASAEQFFLSFVVHTLRPWLTRIETSINTDLVPHEDQESVFAEFKVEGLLRGDIKSRYQSYAIGRQWGWLSADDIRALENMNPLPDGAGKTYLQPMNMIDAKDTDKLLDNSDDSEDSKNAITKT